MDMRKFNMVARKCENANRGPDRDFLQLKYR